MTHNLQTEEKNFYNSIIITKIVWNAILELLRSGIERKISVILRCNWRRIMNVKIAMRQSVSNFSAMYSPNSIWIGLQLEKLSTKIKGWTFYRDTDYFTLMLCYEYCELCCNMVLTFCFLKPLYCSQNYTVSHKTCHFVLDYNSVAWPWTA